MAFIFFYDYKANWLRNSYIYYTLCFVFVGVSLICISCAFSADFFLIKSITDKETNTLIDVVYYLWFRIWGAPQTLISDQEGAITSDGFAALCAKWGCSRTLRPEGSHATIVERHHEVFRQCIHRILTQVKEES